MFFSQFLKLSMYNLGPVVQSNVSLTDNINSLRFVVFTDTVNRFYTEKALEIFFAKILYI